jgi:hypothetical protein
MNDHNFDIFMIREQDIENLDQLFARYGQKHQDNSPVWQLEISQGTSALAMS